jgi:hypothetical protein
MIKLTSINICIYVHMVARFFLEQHTNTGENLPNDNEIFQLPKNIPNGCKIVQMATKYTNI